MMRLSWSWIDVEDRGGKVVFGLEVASYRFRQYFQNNIPVCNLNIYADRIIDS